MDRDTLKKLFRPNTAVFDDKNPAKYLLHITIQLSLFFIVNVVLKRKMYEVAKSPYFCIAYLLILLVISFLSYKYFELPAKKLLRGLAKPSDRV